MKKNLLAIFLILNSVVAFAQNGLELKGYFGFSGTLTGPKAELVGASSVEMERFREFGVMVSSGLGGKFRLNGGINYAYGTVEYFPNLPPCVNCQSISYAHNPDFRMLSIPVYAEYELTRFLYVAAGPLVDFQLSEGNNFDEQSGLGYLVGLGGKVRADKFTFSVFPHYKRHGVMPFDRPENDNHHKDLLQEFGLQFGLGYSF
ncbi:hypothetical protein J0A68_15100 [Algoriphagus sp. H41]|uniref:Outer membrane protein beta-barrel domain-containing protein n=1 Tax=Algoriphagus oliviformis TaxID=2811231 RepID=A0ABS3C6T5_9BACT|nr:hypothetical protein [Algoriphagus oliviformis]MBN7812279.1 hypothetical protein [Algoriphagus oliviformis]